MNPHKNLMRKIAGMMMLASEKSFAECDEMDKRMVWIREAGLP